jgi:hypothetical protein
MRLGTLVVALLSALALGLVACGGGSSNYRLPVDSELKEFSPPDEEDLIASDEDDWGSWADEDFDEPAEPAAAKPAKPAEAKPAEAKPAEAKPAEAKK